MSVEYYDKPKTNIAVRFNLGQDEERRELICRAGKTIIGLFWERPECTFVAVEKDDPTEVQIEFDQDLAEWIGSVALRGDTIQVVTTKNRNGDNFGKTFREIYGWGPRVIIEDYPSDDVAELWLLAHTTELDTEEPLTVAYIDHIIEEAYPEEDEDDE